MHDFSCRIQCDREQSAICLSQRPTKLNSTANTGVASSERRSMTWRRSLGVSTITVQCATRELMGIMVFCSVRRSKASDHGTPSTLSAEIPSHHSTSLTRLHKFSRAKLSTERQQSSWSQLFRLKCDRRCEQSQPLREDEGRSSLSGSVVVGLIKNSAGFAKTHLRQRGNWAPRMPGERKSEPQRRYSMRVDFCLEATQAAIVPQRPPALGQI